MEGLRRRGEKRGEKGGTLRFQPGFHVSVLSHDPSLPAFTVLATNTSLKTSAEGHEVSSKPLL